MVERLIAGIDEVGRGPLAGPVVAAAVVLPAHFELPGLTDSKKLSAKKRMILEQAIIEQALDYSVASVSPEDIDRINILQASLLAMRQAFASLDVAPQAALVDGHIDPGLKVPTRCIVGGDLSEACISAASIVAKQYRDRYMADLATQYPQYGFERHSGYPTKAHLAALDEHGVTPVHRRSYAPVRKILERCA